MEKAENRRRRLVISEMHRLGRTYKEIAPYFYITPSRVAQIDAYSRKESRAVEWLVDELYRGRKWPKGKTK
jgi:hypothetical protein